MRGKVGFYVEPFENLSVCCHLLSDVNTVKHVHVLLVC